MATAAPEQVQEVVVTYEARGGALELMAARELEVCLDGPAGTGKTIAALYKLHMTCLKYPNTRCFITRKTNTSLTGSALETFRNHIIHPSEGVKWFGGSNEKPAGYRYPNGSFVAIFGMDKKEKVRSWEFDRGLINEATECTEDDLEYLRARMRNGKTPYHQIMMDVNPDAPGHWLNQRMNPIDETFDASKHKTRRLLSRHEDNPRFYDVATASWTPEGFEYIEHTLGGLTGIRYLRYKAGIWASAEGLVYEEWDKAKNLLERSAISSRPDTLYGDCGINRQWKRFLVFDFGFTHPFVCQWWAEDGDGRLYLYREIYMTGRTVKDHCEVIKKYSQWGQEQGDPLPYQCYADPSNAEGIKQLKTHLGKEVLGAKNDIATGIDTVKDRLKVAGDGLPRLFILQDSLIERDSSIPKGEPTSTVAEIDSYVWLDGKRKDEPVDKWNHGMDTMRYISKQRSPRVSGRATKIKMF
jgi:PBSX family phage terminase large subunit